MGEMAESEIPENKIPQAAIDAYLAGTELAREKEYKKATPFFLKALEIYRYYPEAIMNLGVCFLYTGKLKAAEASLKLVECMVPEWPEVEYNLGLVYLSSGEFDEARTQFHKAIALKPDYREAKLNVAVSFWQEGEVHEAIALFRALIDVYPDYPEAYVNLGGIFLDSQNLTYSIEMFNIAMDLAEGGAVAAMPLAEAYNKVGASADAIAVLKKSFENKMDRGVLRFYIQLLIKALRFEEADQEIDNALLLYPKEPSFHTLRATYYQELGETDKMAKMFLSVATDEEMSWMTYSATLFGMNYAETSFDAQTWELYKIFDQRMKEYWQDINFFYSGDRDPNRPLRVAYISGDYRAHSVSYFIESLFRYHDRSQFTPVVLQEGSICDHRTTYLRGLVDEWHEIWRLSDQALARKIVDLKIDILVDLSGHTSSHRMEVFALRAAPVQVTWLGYPNTTGIRNIDYRMVDRWTDPVGQGDDLHSETLYRLDRCFLCYSAPEMTPEAQPRLSVADGTVVFGSFNNPAKINRRVLALWARILHEIPNSRLFIKGRQMGTEAGQARYRKMLEDLGVSIDRVDLVPQMAGVFDHLTVYNEIDIALDSFPYNGTTTTCEAMMMGVPVITLTGNAHRHRVGDSLLNAVGLSDLVAKTEDEYVDIARRLAADPHRLVDLRKTLRQKLLASSLCDGSDLTRHFELAYRKMWQDFSQSDRFKR